MLTMKIITNNEDGAIHIEGRNISYKSYSSDENKKENKGSNIRKILKTEEAWFVNPEYDVSFCVIQYWDDNDKYKSLVLFSVAKVYIMQNGNTIDSIVI